MTFSENLDFKVLAQIEKQKLGCPHFIIITQFQLPFHFDTVEISKLSWAKILREEMSHNTKGVFFSESEIRFSNLPKNYSKKLSWAWNLNKLFTDVGGNFKFQAQDSFLE